VNCGLFSYRIRLLQNLVRGSRMIFLKSNSLMRRGPHTFDLGTLATLSDSE
jgi:hypothetical protein